jgi:hypothetical protein
VSRLAAAGFIAIMSVVALVAYRIEGPRQLVTEADDQYEQTIAAGVAAQAAALTPTATPYVSPTPTKTPKPPTATAYPTYAAEASPGFYLVPKWTEVPVNTGTIEAGMAPCIAITPNEYTDLYCEVEP